MSLQDPLAPFRAASGHSGDDLEGYLARTAPDVLQVWSRGGPPSALTPDAFVFVKEDTIYDLPRSEVRGVHRVRDTDTSMIRWGLGVYLLALPVAIIGFLVPALLMAVVGGGLVTKAYLSYALVVEVTDDRVPPFTLEHRKAKRIEEAIRSWKRSSDRAHAGGAKDR